MIQSETLKKMMMRIISLLFFMALFLFGPAGRAAGEEPVTIRLWQIPIKNATTTDGKARRAIFERFLELHPHINILQASGIQLEQQEAMDAVLMAIAGGTAPDVLYVNFGRATKYIEQGLLAPLDKYVAEWEEDLNEKINPLVWPVIKQKGPPDGKEHIYAIPYGAPYVMGLQYRKDLFRKAGLNPDKPPRNWDEFYEYARALTLPEKGQYGWCNQLGMHGAYIFSNFIYQAGGDLVQLGEDGKWRAVYNNEAGVEALKFYHKLVRGKWTRDGKEYQGVVVLEGGHTSWGQGKVGMQFSPIREDSLFSSNTNPDLVGIAPMPAGPGGRRGAEFNQTMYGIFAGTKDQRKRLAAWEFIKFRASDEATRIFTKVFVEAGEAKYLNPKYLKKFGYPELVKEVMPGLAAIHEQAMAGAVAAPHGKNCDQIYYELVDPLDNVLLYDKVDYQAVLDRAVAHTNEKLIGEIPHKEMQRRRRIVWVVFAFLVLMVLFFIARYIRTVSQNIQSASQPGKSTCESNWHFRAVLFMLPAILSILVWQYYPLIRGTVMAFLDYRVMGGSKFIGIDNFVTAFWQPVFWIALKNTFIYVFLTIAIGFLLPVILALMLNEIPRGTLFFRIIYYLPMMTSPMVIMLLWKQFYLPTEAGLLNKLVMLLGMGAQTWLQDPRLAMICVIIPGIWGSMGAGCIIYLAALKSVPEELYEAAALDGAGVFRKVWNITFPRLRVLLIINFVGTFIGAFHATERILMMTGGGPLRATHVIGLEIFYNAFVYLKFGYATAMAWILGSMLIGFTLYQLRILRSVKFTTAK